MGAPYPSSFKTAIIDWWIWRCCHAKRCSLELQEKLLVQFYLRICSWHAQKPLDHLGVLHLEYSHTYFSTSIETGNVPSVCRSSAFIVSKRLKRWGLSSTKLFIFKTWLLACVSTKLDIYSVVVPELEIIGRQILVDILTISAAKHILCQLVWEKKHFLLLCSMLHESGYP